MLQKLISRKFTHSVKNLEFFCHSILDKTEVQKVPLTVLEALGFNFG